MCQALVRMIDVVVLVVFAPLFDVVWMRGAMSCIDSPDNSGFEIFGFVCLGYTAFYLGSYYDSFVYFDWILDLLLE